LVDTDESVEDDGLHYLGMRNNQAPALCDPETENFRLSAGSALMQGTWSSVNNLGEDLDGNAWGTFMWKGCYAFDENSPCD
jgi:hypothetical protein